MNFDIFSNIERGTHGDRSCPQGNLGQKWFQHLSTKFFLVSVNEFDIYFETRKYDVSSSNSLVFVEYSYSKLMIKGSECRSVLDFDY